MDRTHNGEVFYITLSVRPIVEVILSIDI